jgi:hypothetical protein
MLGGCRHDDRPGYQCVGRGYDVLGEARAVQGGRSAITA